MANGAPSCVTSVLTVTLTSKSISSVSLADRIVLWFVFGNFGATTDCQLFYPIQTSVRTSCCCWQPLPMPQVSHGEKVELFLFWKLSVPWVVDEKKPSPADLSFIKNKAIM